VADKVTTTQSPRGKDFVRAFLDLLILVLLLVCAAFGGYWYGIHERVIPVASVPPGTPGAHTEEEAQAAQASIPAQTKPNTESPSKTETASSSSKSDSEKPAAEPAKTGKKKYWLYSSGKDYIGYSITVSVNDNQVDSFFGPGKIVDITSQLQPGDNTILFDAKKLAEDGYNKHKGDAAAQLVIQVVSGPKVNEEFKHSDVAATFARNATESEDVSETKHINVK
jgi:hypothetical protein